MKTAALIIMTNLPEKNGVIASLQSAGSVCVGQRMIAALTCSGVSLTLIVTGPNPKKIAKVLTQEGVLFLRNRNPDSTVMESVRMGLSFLRGNYDRILVMPGDVPLFYPDTVRALLSGKAPAVLPVYRGVQGYPICLSSAAAGKILKNESAATLEEALAACPLETERIRVSDAGVTIRAAALSRKKAQLARQNSRLIHPAVSVSLSGAASLYDERLSSLLHLVEETRSVRLACELMQISYSSGWNMLNAAEDALGFPLITRLRGGAIGGGSVLTQKGRALMIAYDRLSAEVRENALRLFAEYFQDFLE